jgi:hypothetical protein
LWRRANRLARTTANRPLNAGGEGRNKNYRSLVSLAESRNPHADLKNFTLTTIFFRDFGS